MENWGLSKKDHRFNAFSTNVNTINLNIFPTYVGINNSEKFQEPFMRYKSLISLERYERM